MTDPATLRAEEAFERALADLLQTQSQAEVARTAGLDPAQITRRATRVYAGEACWSDLFSARQIMRVGRSFPAIHAALGHNSLPTMDAVPATVEAATVGAMAEAGRAIACLSDRLTDGRIQASDERPVIEAVIALESAIAALRTTIERRKG